MVPVASGDGVFDSIEELFPILNDERSSWGRFWSKVRQVKVRAEAVEFELRCAYQRAVRGYDDKALWNLGTWLPKAAGQVLIHMAEHSVGYPVDWKAEDWASALRENGQKLLDFSERDERLLRFGTDFERANIEFERLHHEAEIALAWVGANLPRLWD